MSLASEKLHKALKSLHKAIDNLEKGNKRLAIGDLDFAKENCQEVIYLLIDDIKNERSG